VRKKLFLIAGIIAALSRPCGAFEAAFWTWQRAEPLEDSERDELRACGVHTLFWYMGEMEIRDKEWRWKNTPFPIPASMPELRFVPVIRLTSFVRAPFAQAAALAEKIHAAAGDEAQLDMDCPDRLLSDYAEALRAIHARVRRLSITALEGWIVRPAWAALQASVDEVEPMFYDTRIDPPSGPLPLADPAKFRAQLAEWSACKTAWRAGLPNFSRLTLYDGATGLSRGHIRQWNWDDVCFSRAFTAAGPVRLGTTVFLASERTSVGNIPIGKGSLVGVRWPDRAALAGAVEAVKKTNALGVVYFRLPDSTDASGWSLRQLEHLEAKPVLVLRKPRALDLLELANTGNGDLEPRRYALEITAPSPVFREALEGDFQRVEGSVLAARLTFWFSHLRAGQSLRTGLLQLAPGADFSQIHYRILPVDPTWNVTKQ